LFNRRHFDAELSARTEKKDSQRIEPFGLLLIDVDYFKNYNDRYGHQAGEHRNGIRAGKTVRTDRFPQFRKIQCRVAQKRQDNQAEACADSASR